MGDIYCNYDRIDKSRELVEKSALSSSNSEYLQEFIDYLMADSFVGDHKLYRYVQTFRILADCGVIDFDLKNAEKKEVRRLVGRINQNRIPGKTYAAESRNEMRKSINKFYEFVYDEEQPEIVDFVSSTVKQSDKKDVDPSSLPKYEHVKRMVEACNNPRDRAMVYMLWESGSRVGEFLGLNWSDVSEEVNDDGQKYLNLQLVGKTGERCVPVVECRETVLEWKDKHKCSEPDYPVFTPLNRVSRYSYSGFNAQLTRIADRACVDRKTNPHAFRKSRATYLANNGASVFDLMKLFGWSKPDIAKVYVRIAQTDVEDLVMNTARL